MAGVSADKLQEPLGQKTGGRATVAKQQAIGEAAQNVYVQLSGM
jgi:hypothetical protein